MTFDKLNLIAPIRKALDEKGYKDPTAIQVQTIPPILRGRDVQGCTQSGTGKTGAYVIPIIQNLMTDEIPEDQRGHPRVLLLCPANELALQIKKSFEAYGKYSGLKCALVIADDSLPEPSKEVLNESDILVATPGRLLELININSVSLDKIEILVIDEAEKMFEPGLAFELNEIRKLLPEKKQTLLFYVKPSAEIESLSKQILHEPVIVGALPQLAQPGKIRQAVYFVSWADKPSLLVHLIKEEEIPSAVVFIRSKDTAKKLVEHLNNEGITAQTFHGKISPMEREIRVENLKTNKTRVLVATDLASKEVLLDNLAHVFNFDMPLDGVSYFDRIAIVGRNGAKGFAFSLCEDTELKFLKKVEAISGELIPVIENHPFVMEINNSVNMKPAKQPQKKNSDEFLYDYISAKATYLPEPPSPNDAEPEGKKKRKRLVKKEQTFMSSSIPKEKNKGKK